MPHAALMVFIMDNERQRGNSLAIHYDLDIQFTGVRFLFLSPDLIRYERLADVEFVTIPRVNNNYTLFMF